MSSTSRKSLSTCSSRLARLTGFFMGSAFPHRYARPEEALLDDRAWVFLPVRLIRRLVPQYVGCRRDTLAKEALQWIIKLVLHLLPDTTRTVTGSKCYVDCN